MQHLGDSVDLESMPPDDRARVERALAAISPRGFAGVFVPDRQAALEKVLNLIRKGASVAHGTSTTLEEIGFVERMRRPDSGYRYLNDEWRAENDAAKRGRLRTKLSGEADVYLGSVQAVCETGECVGADESGSRQAFTRTGRRA